MIFDNSEEIEERLVNTKIINLKYSKINSFISCETLS